MDYSLKHAVLNLRNCIYDLLILTLFSCAFSTQKSLLLSKTDCAYSLHLFLNTDQATIEQQVKFIDGAMEAIHLQATSEGGQYTKEQRLIMKYVNKFLLT